VPYPHFSGQRRTVSGAAGMMGAPAGELLCHRSLPRDRRSNPRASALLAGIYGPAGP